MSFQEDLTKLVIRHELDKKLNIPAIEIVRYIIQCLKTLNTKFKHE